MRVSNFLLTTFAVAAVAFGTVAESSYAQRGDRGGGGGGGGDRGGGGGGSSMRSSGGGGGGSSMRSRGGDSGGSSIRSGGGDSSSFRSGGGPSGSRSSGSMNRSSGSQFRSSDRGGDSGASSSRSIQGRSGQQQQSFYRGPSSDSNRGDRDSVRTARDFDRGDSNRGGSNRGDTNRGDTIRRDLDRGDTNRGDSNGGDRAGRDSDARRGDLNNFLSGRDNDRDRGDRGDRGDLNRGDRNRLEGDRNRFDNDRDRGDRDRFSGDRNRFDNDRNRFAGDRDRNDWSRDARRLRDDWGRRDRNSLPFRYGWWNGYALDRWPIYSPWRYSRWQNRPYYWWGWTPATALTSWIVYGWDRPRYWSYGPGGNIWYEDNYVYYDGNRYLPADDYYQRVYDLAHSVPAINQQDAENMDWKPLGVFAVIPEGRDDSDSQRTFQLAVNRDGVIAGTFVDDRNNDVHPVSGMVDRNSQRAAWVFADGTNPNTVFETSLFNLTRADATVMVHHGASANDTEIWHLVRLERPEASQVSISQ